MVAREEKPAPDAGDKEGRSWQQWFSCRVTISNAGNVSLQHLEGAFSAGNDTQVRSAEWSGNTDGSEECTGRISGRRMDFTVPLLNPGEDLTVKFHVSGNPDDVSCTFRQPDLKVRTERAGAPKDSSVSVLDVLMREGQRVKNPYVVQGQAEECRRSYCVYMDVLGFSSMVDEAHRKGCPGRFFGEFRRATSDASSFLRPPRFPEWSPPMWERRVFSDNIVLGCPLEPVDGMGAIQFNFLPAQIADYQTFLALNGFFVRGGFTVGELFVGENLVYGKALIEAHSLDSKGAPPRVAFSEEARVMIWSHLRMYVHDPNLPQLRFVEHDTDGTPFLNYLASLVRDGGVAWNLLGEHRDRVQEALARFRECPEVGSKYEWVAAYHNRFCETLRDRQGYDETYRVTQPPN
jgi:hypothetical protein